MQRCDPASGHPPYGLPASVACGRSQSRLQPRHARAELADVHARELRRGRAAQVGPLGDLELLQLGVVLPVDADRPVAAINASHVRSRGTRWRLLLEEAARRRRPHEDDLAASRADALDVAHGVRDDTLPHVVGDRRQQAAHQTDPRALRLLLPRRVAFQPRPQERLTAIEGLVQSDAGAARSALLISRC